VADSLFALASAPGRAAIAVWRLSGPDVAAALAALTGRPPPPPRRATLRALLDPANGALLDQALVLFMPGPASFTGEDSAELHTHGGRAVAEAVGAVLGRLKGFRPAEPGEFSRRAFFNGKLDLTTAEAIADLAAAETEAQRRQAVVQAGGALATLYDGWRERLIRLRAHLEAAMEFPDEDIGDPAAGMAEGLVSLKAEIARHLADSWRGERLREGLTIAVVGAPNAGKSTLINALARRDIAIVSPEAGTTRDIIEVHLDLGGYPVILVDTAGLRVAQGLVEAEGIARARARAVSADLVLALFAADAPDDAETLALIDERAVLVTSKADLAISEPPHPNPLPGEARRHEETPWPLQGEGGARVGGRVRGAEDGGHIAISAKTHAGMDILLAALNARISDLLADRGAPPPTRARHREALAQCLAALDAVGAAPLPELAAEELRRAADALARIVGRMDIEEMLDSVFRDFCIGK
jgi:tRNA modification GTPase